MLALLAGGRASADDASVEDYVIRPGDTVTTILFRRGIGTPESPHRLYGKGGWVQRMQALNPGVDLSRIYPGAILKIPTLRDENEVASESALTEGIQEEKTLETPAPAAPPISPEEASDRVRSVSFLNRGQADPEVLQSLPATPPAYLGFRVGKSLSNSPGLLSKIMTYGLIAEIRGGTFEGLRLLYEITPKVHARFQGQKESLTYNRTLLGWAFEWQAPFLFDLVHFTPRLGRYSFEARSRSATRGTVDTLYIDTAPALGGEFDLEFARYFYVLRFWAAGDWPFKASAGNFQTTSTRAGIDVYLKGGGFSLFGRNVSPSYLVYTSLEDFKIEGKSQRQGEQLQMLIPIFGLGYTLNLN